jgi:hypothetical protein
MLKKLGLFKKSYIRLLQKIDFIQESLGRIELKLQSNSKDLRIEDSEFKVYSQSGEDGIIQYLISKIPNIPNKFIEFGVENYLESNTRFLILNNYWTGLIIDGDKNNIEFIKSDPIYWRSQLTAINSFVTKDNINDLIESNNFSGEVGILSVDVDGNDYWIWDSITVCNPSIVIVEYNSFFGLENAVTIPYVENFVRSEAHHSLIYYGASIKAFELLGEKKGYELVFTNKAGNNLFFVNKKYKNIFHKTNSKEAYRKSNYRETHDSNGKLIFKPFEISQKEIFDCDVFDVAKNQIVKIKNIL